MSLFKFFLGWISLWSLTLSGQDSSLVVVQQGIWIGGDLLGVSLMPASGAIRLDDGFYLRHEIQVGYQSNKAFFGYLALGRDQRKGGPVYTNVLEYDYTSEYLRIMLGARYKWTDRSQLMLAFGGSFAKTEDKGVITIGDGYFSPYVQPFSKEYNEYSFVLESGPIIRIVKRLELRLTVLRYFGHHNNPSDESILFVAGAGKNTFPRRDIVWGTGVRGHLTYTFEL
jgi:hypothetical protein